MDTTHEVLHLPERQFSDNLCETNRLLQDAMKFNGAASTPRR